MSCGSRGVSRFLRGVVVRPAFTPIAAHSGEDGRLTWDIASQCAAAGVARAAESTTDGGPCCPPLTGVDAARGRVLSSMNPPTSAPASRVCVASRRYLYRAAEMLRDAASCRTILDIRNTMTTSGRRIGDDGGAPIPRVGATASLTQQVLDAMVRAIRAGSFPSGRLPPEDDLAIQLGVSRTTLRRALQSLEQIGLLERRPGRGTRLRAHARPDLLALHGLVPFPTLLRELGYDVASQVTWRLHPTVPRELALQLEREVTGGSYELDVVLLANDEPAVRMIERFSADVLDATPSDEDLQTGSILLTSERCFREKIDHALATIEPCVVSRKNNDPGRKLGLPPGNPYLALHERFFSAEEIPLATSEVSLNPKYISFSVFRRFL